MRTLFYFFIFVAHCASAMNFNDFWPIEEQAEAELFGFDGPIFTPPLTEETIARRELSADLRIFEHQGRAIRACDPAVLSNFIDYHEAMLMTPKAQVVFFGKICVSRFIPLCETLMPIRQQFDANEELWVGRLFYPERARRAFSDGGYSQDKNLAFMAGAMAANKDFYLVTPFSFYYKKVVGLVTNKEPEDTRSKYGITLIELTWLAENNYQFFLSEKGFLRAKAPEIKLNPPIMRHYEEVVNRDIVVAFKYILNNLLDSMVNPQSVRKLESINPRCFAELTMRGENKNVIKRKKDENEPYVASKKLKISGTNDQPDSAERVLIEVPQGDEPELCDYNIQEILANYGSPDIEELLLADLCPTDLFAAFE